MLLIASPKVYLLNFQVRLHELWHGAIKKLDCRLMAFFSLLCSSSLILREVSQCRLLASFLTTGCFVSLHILHASLLKSSIFRRFTSQDHLLPSTCYFSSLLHYHVYFRLILLTICLQLHRLKSHLCLFREVPLSLISISLYYASSYQMSH